MRPVRMANHFQKMGLETRVIAGCPSTYDGRGHLDPGLESLVSPQVEVLRVPLGPPPGGLWRRLILSGYTQHPDEIGLRWKTNLWPALVKELEEFQPDFVLITIPPFSLHSVAHAVSARGVPLVVDFRDAWSQWILTPYATYLHYRHRLACERALIRSSSLTTVTSQVTLRDLARLHGAEAEQKLEYIPNSFDQFESPEFSQISQAGHPLRLLYLGTFYYNPASQSLSERPWYRKKPHQWFQYAPRKEDWSYRGPQRLLQVFDRFLQLKNPSQKVSLTIAGSKPDWWDSVLTSERLRQHCQHLGPQPKEEALRLLSESDAVVITSSKVLGGADYSIAGKTFEYLAARKPILAFVCEGAQKDLLQASGCALCLDPDQTEGAARQMEELMAGKMQLSPNQSFVEDHLTERVLGRLLASIERRISESSRR